MRRVTIALLIGVFLVGLVCGLGLPLILPRQSIYDRLRSAGVSVEAGSWYPNGLRSAWSVQQAQSFEVFVQLVGEKGSLGVVQIDTGYNVLWVEEKEGSLVSYVGFYCYTETD